MSGRLLTWLALAAAFATLVVGVVYGTHAAGGSDSSCYLNAARLLARREVALRQPLADGAPWKDAISTLTPAGFVPSPIDPLAVVPICPPGLPLTMAAFRALGLTEFLVVPILGALAVWLTFVIGRRMDRPLTGAGAALLFASSPTLLYQLVQPMSDVPATAWWLLAIAWSIERGDDSTSAGSGVVGPPEGGRHDHLRADGRHDDMRAGGRHSTIRTTLAGVAASLALLTRPNLLPLAVVMALYLFTAGRPSLVSGFSRTFADSKRILMAFVAGLVPGLLLLGVLQGAAYGSPLATGYGAVGQLMSFANVAPNLQRYGVWLLGAHTPFLLLALAAPFFARKPRQAWLGLAVAATTLVCYLPYLVFDDWWYTRFLLPAIPLLVILSVVTLVAGIDALKRSAGTAAFETGWIVIGVLVVMAGTWIVTARARHVFDLSEWEQHYYRAGTAVAAHIESPSVIVTVRNSGSVVYHSGQPILSWDALEPASLDSALAFIRDRGYAAYLLLEIDEEPSFRERFGATSAVGRLDWPPRVQAGSTIRIYDPLDRATFFANEKVPTEFVRDSPVPPRDWRRWLKSQ